MDAISLSQDEERKVPRNLIPVVASKMDTEWSKSTIQYAYLFCDYLKYADKKNLGTVNDWVKLGNMLQTDLQNIGKREYLKHIKDYFQKENIYITENKLKRLPNNIDDITSIIIDKEWYNNNISCSRKIIFYITHNVFQKGNNQWLENASRQWAIQKNIVIDQTIATSFKKCKRVGKDFVYSNMLHGISQTIVRKWKYHVKLNHGEFLLNRKKESKTNKYAKYKCTQYQMEGPTCYLYTVKETKKEKLLRNLEISFRECIENNIELSEIETRLDTCLNDKYINDTVLTQEKCELGKKLMC